MLFLPNLEAASTIVNLQNTLGTELRDFNGNLLTSGTSSTNDGAVLQLGYYTLATTLDPFSGVWVPLTGEGSGNPSYSTIGDKDLTDGRFLFGQGFSSLNPNIPLAGMPLTIRFYDSTSIAGSTYFNAVSNTSGLWNWVTPTNLNPMINISLGDSGIVWQDGGGSAFRTTIAVPEPSAVIVLALTTGTLALRRRRVSSNT